jgi:23S rRNA (uridine2552-2'-O)-methyltransferase
MKGNPWDDHYARKARREEWLARSVYKLEEIDKRFELIRKGSRILDLGCHPGSWSQYASLKTGPKGEVVGVDLNPPERFSAANFRFIQADVFTLDPVWLVREIGPRDVVMSDLAPRTTGSASTDVSRSIDLARRALELATHLLKTGGQFVCKVFEGEDFGLFRDEVASRFGRTKPFRPPAVRKRSREVYIVGKGFSGP